MSDHTQSPQSLESSEPVTSHPAEALLQQWELLEGNNRMNLTTIISHQLINEHPHPLENFTMEDLLTVLNRRYFEHSGSPTFQAADIETIFRWAKEEPDSDGGMFVRRWSPIVRIFHESNQAQPSQDISPTERDTDCYDLEQATLCLEWFYRDLTGKEDLEGSFSRMVKQRLEDTLPRGRVSTRPDPVTSDQVSHKSSSSESPSESSSEGSCPETYSNSIKEKETVQQYWIRVIKVFLVTKLRP